MELATDITRTRTVTTGGTTLAAAMIIVTALIVATASATTRGDVVDLDTTGEPMMTRATRDKTDVEAMCHGHRGVARG